MNTQLERTIFPLSVLIILLCGVCYLLPAENGMDTAFTLIGFIVSIGAVGVVGDHYYRKWFKKDVSNADD